MRGHNLSYYDLLDRLGIEVLSERQNRHRVARVKLPDGRQATITLPLSPSCSRAYRNFRATVMRLLRGASTKP